MTPDTPVAIVVRGLDDNIIGWSQGAARLTGYAAEEVLGRSMRLLCPSQAAAGEAATGEPMVAKSGRSMRVRRIRTPVRGERGELVAFTELLLGTDAEPDRGRCGCDPEGHARERGALARSDGPLAAVRLHALLESTPYGCLLLDEHGRIAGLNEAARRMFGYLEGELLAKPAQLLVPAVPPRRDELDTSAEEPRARRKDGSAFPVQIGLGTVQADDAQFVLATVRDLSATMNAGDALRESAHRFRQVINALPLLVWSALPDGRCIFVSARCSEYTGAAAEQFYGWRWSELVHPADRERALSVWRSALQQPTDVVTELRLRRHDGTYRWFETRATAVYDDDGQIVRWFGCHADVHEARLAREALAREREHLERIIATAPGAFFCYRRTPDGALSISHISAALEHMVGETGEQIESGASSLSLVHPDDRQRVRDQIEASAESLLPMRAEHRILSPTAGERWVESNAIPMLEEDGSIQWLGFLQDITPRKAAIESLRTAQEHLLAALEAGGMGILEWDIQNDRLTPDECSLKLLRRPRELLSGPAESLLSCVHSEDAANVRAGFAALADGVEEVSFEYRAVLPDGDFRWLSARARSQRDGAQRPVRATLLQLDVTPQKRSVERELRSQKLEALGTLAGGIAHDFNNMLHAISGNTALALRKLEPEHPARPMLEAIELAGTRAAELVRRILQFSRPTEQHRHVLSLRAIVSEALKLVRATVPSRIEIREELGGSTPFVEADPTQIHQIILNLATNAAHAIGPASGYLHVHLETIEVRDDRPRVPADLPSGGYAALHVSDSGCGMDREIAQRVFDPFFTTKAIGEGTGLGLSVVHGIMKSLGGAVSVHSEPGLGSTFTLFFPLARPREEVRAELPSRAVERPGGRVLFVDDEHILVELGTHTLKALGYDVLGFARPREALRAFLQDPGSIDVVITDLAMPDLSGFDLAARILEVRPELPIVMISGNVGPDELAAAQRLGLADVLLKPVGLEALGNALANALRKRRSMHPDT